MLSLTRSSNSFVKSEIEWRRHTLWGLVRVMMQYRRTGRSPDLQKAKGVAAYAEAFQLSFGNCLRSTTGTRTFVPTNKLNVYDFKHIRESIDISAVDRGLARNANWQALTLGVTIVLAVLLAWSSFGGKLLSLRLAVCNSELAAHPGHSFRDSPTCQGILADSVTWWERLAHGHPLALILMLSGFLALIRDPLLLDIPLGESWIARRWEAILATFLLFIYALHTTMFRLSRRMSAHFVWFVRLLPLALLIVIISSLVWRIYQLVGML
jgi:hypothetical protein